MGSFATRHLVAFFALTYAITWGIAALLVASPEWLISSFGEIDLARPFWRALFHLAVYAPALGAFAVIAAVTGRVGVLAYVRRLLRWRVGLTWVAVVLVGYPVITLLATAVTNAVAGQDLPLFPVGSWLTVVPLFLVSLVIDPGPVEELGWRGFALPLLQRRFGALSASLILGAIWAIWHLPAFALSAMPQSAFDLPIFLLANVAFALAMTCIYNSTGGNVLLMFLLHGIANFDYGADVQSTPTEMLVQALLLGVVAASFAVRFGVARLGRRKETEILDGEGAQV